MKQRPAGWVVRFRLGVFERVLLGYGAVVGLFFSVICFGGVIVVVRGLLDGTALPAPHGVATLVGIAASALFALWFGSLSLRWAIGSLADLLGSEVALQGQIEELAVHRGVSGRHYDAVVAGQPVALSSEVFATLAKGDTVWMRVGRHQRALKELARPDRPALPPLPPRGAAAITAKPAGSPKGGSPVAASTSGKRHTATSGPIADADLRRSDVPAATAPWTEVERFALRYDGATGPALSALLERHQQAGTLPETLGELRAILYLEQRRHRHLGRAPWGSDLQRVRTLVETIRARVPPDA